MAWSVVWIKAWCAAGRAKGNAAGSKAGSKAGSRAGAKPHLHVFWIEELRIPLRKEKGFLASLDFLLKKQPGQCFSADVLFGVGPSLVDANTSPGELMKSTSRMTTSWIPEEDKGTYGAGAYPGVERGGERGME